MYKIHFLFCRACLLIIMRPSLSWNDPYSPQMSFSNSCRSFLIAVFSLSFFSGGCGLVGSSIDT